MTARTAQTTTRSPEETRDVGSRLGRHLHRGDLVVLTGDLGAGKTCFTQGVGAGLEVSDPVTSPTFALHQIYEGRDRLNHLDVYRMDHLVETLDLDLPELLEDGVTVIEWGENIVPVLPEDHLTVRLLLDPEEDNRRTIRFEASGTRSSELVEEVLPANRRAVGEVEC